MSYREPDPERTREHAEAQRAARRGARPCARTPGDHAGPALAGLAAAPMAAIAWILTGFLALLISPLAPSATTVLTVLVGIFWIGSVPAGLMAGVRAYRREARRGVEAAPR